MIKIENAEVVGWEAAIRGMRNPKNSWDRMDSYIPACVGDCDICEDDTCKNIPSIYGDFVVGTNDHKLMMNLAAGGPVHAKYRRMITVYVDITAPLYWWKEFDTYKVGTVANSCSTMHKIHDKEFELCDFSTEHITSASGTNIMMNIIDELNEHRKMFNTNKEPEIKKDHWWNMIQLLPSSYNQKRTIMLNYEVLAGIYPMRKNHKLDEWHDFCDWIKSLPYSEIIVGWDEALSNKFDMPKEKQNETATEKESN